MLSFHPTRPKFDPWLGVHFFSFQLKMNTEDWFYIGEGAQNIVVGYKGEDIKYVR
jgi:hypothetical protein